MRAVTDDALRDETVDGVHYQVTGSGEQTLVLIHGFSDNLATWRRVVPALAVHHRVIAIDLPSHGLSQRSWRHPLLDTYVDVVDEVLAHEGIDGPISLMGNSMGGAVAALYAHQNPDRVDAVVLIGMPGVSGVPKAWRLASSRPAELWLRTVTKPVPLAPLLAAFAWTYTHAAVPHSRSIDPATVLSYCASYPDRGRLFDLHPLARALMRDLLRVRLHQVLTELPMPVMQMWGRFDPLVPARHAPRGGEHIVVLRNCGHCPQLDAPEQVLGYVLPFFAAASGASLAEIDESLSAVADAALAAEA
ncbi:MAG: alpha/beta fold hydrolase [Jatrophihabitans sp.]|uniref:alpha/beta fold hydrolase n=1 Tax=Jatrophihabitans sp. TaxID=1932789 RepID=UPI003F80B19D